MEVIKPPRLSPGDTIGIITPASPMLPERLTKGIEYLKGLGYEVIEGDNVRRGRGYLAGTDEERADDINRMFENPSVKAMICSRGGYGTPRLLDLVDYDVVRKNPKILVGYSDLTTLELAIWQQSGLVTFSGPMAAVEMGKGIHPFTAHHFWRTLTVNKPVGELPLPDNGRLHGITSGKTRGRLLGGCLSMISPLMGTKYVPDFEGAILFLEDIDEEVYRLDRYFAQLRTAGILDKLSGIVLGTFLDCKPADPEKPSLTIDEVIDDYTNNLGIPVAAGLPYGHGDVKVTIPLGVEAVLDADNGTLEIIEAAVT